MKLFSTVRSRSLAAAAALAALAFGVSLTPLTAAADAQPLPAPALDLKPAGSGTETALFAGGCFWGIQGVFQHVKGVTKAVSGYSGGKVVNPTYEQVSTGTTGHAEAVAVTFDPTQVSYATLLRIFFSVALDPTQVDRQGPDFGTQYRSALFVTSPEQEKVARAYVAQLETVHAFSRPIATKVEASGAFYPAEAYHQDYLTLHPDAPYIAAHDLPKVRAVQNLFPEAWQSKPVLVAGN